MINFNANNKHMNEQILATLGTYSERFTQTVFFDKYPRTLKDNLFLVVFFSGDGDKIILDLDLGEEMDMIDLCESLVDLLKHPLAEAFLYAKWKTLTLAYLLNYMCYSIFLIFISGFIKCEVTISGYNKSGNNGWCEALYSPGSFIFGYCTRVCGAVYLTVREIIQFWKKVISISKFQLLLHSY